MRLKPDLDRLMNNNYNNSKKKNKKKTVLISIGSESSKTSKNNDKTGTKHKTPGYALLINLAGKAKN